MRHAPSRRPRAPCCILSADQPGPCCRRPATPSACALTPPHRPQRHRGRTGKSPWTARWSGTWPPALPSAPGCGTGLRRAASPRTASAPSATASTGSAASRSRTAARCALADERHRSSGVSGRTALLESFSYAFSPDAAGGSGWSVWGRIDTGEFSGGTPERASAGSSVPVRRLAERHLARL